jgi:Mn-dependent DtxR family transcriptional regulator
MLTAIQEDYLEMILRITQIEGEVRITDLAKRLGCKLPTVTRTVRRMVLLGVVAHESRGTVNLTRSGRAAAEELVHRHEDLVRFLNVVLGLLPDQAEKDACQLEHGLSPLAAARLHRFLLHLDKLETEPRRLTLEFPGREQDELPDFHSLPATRAAGWRG